MYLRILCFIVFLFSIGCGIESEIPSSSEPNGSQPDEVEVLERAVYINEVNTNHKGTTVHCRLNPLLPFDSSIVVFTEFEGTRVETKSFPSLNANVAFSRYNPPSDGNIVCVIEYAGAEFESAPLWVESQ